MSDEPHRFRVIEGGDQPKPYRARKKREAEILTCSTCEADTGVATALTLEMRQGRMIRDGKASGGTKGVYCAHCLARGKVTKLL